MKRDCRVLATEFLIQLSLERGLRFCMSCKFPSRADVGGLETTL